MTTALIKKQIFIFALFAICYLLFAITPASAQTNSNNTPNTAPDVPKNLHTWTQSVMIEVMSAMTCQLAGIDPTQPNGQCLGIDQKTGKIGYIETNGGAIGFTGQMIAMLYTPPIHTGDYFQNLAQNFGIVKTANAQGVGFTSLSPLLELWKTFRNIVYLIFILVFIIIGLAIMLRVKIDPRTVMTIQNQIPKIIIGILLVTFSFAIAGFLVDLMWVMSYLIYGIIRDIPGLSPTAIVRMEGLSPINLQGANPFGGVGMGNFDDITKGVSSSINDIIKGMFGIIIGSIIGFLVGPLARLIITIALVIGLFRLWLALVMAFIHILIDVVLAPFWIVGSLVPGSPVSATGWLRDIIANLAIFPAVIGMFLLGVVFIDGFKGSGSPGAFVPPLIGSLDPNMFGAVIGLGIILMTPSAICAIKAAIKAPKFDTSGAGKLIGAGAGVPVAGGKTVASFYAKTPAIGAKGGAWGAARSIFKF